MRSAWGSGRGAPAGAPFAGSRGPAQNELGRARTLQYSLCPSDIDEDDRDFRMVLADEHFLPDFERPLEQRQSLLRPSFGQEKASLVLEGRGDPPVRGTQSPFDRLDRTADELSRTSPVAHGEAELPQLAESECDAAVVLAESVLFDREGLFEEGKSPGELLPVPQDTRQVEQRHVHLNVDLSLRPDSDGEGALEKTLLAFIVAEGMLDVRQVREPGRLAQAGPRRLVENPLGDENLARGSA